MLRTGYVLSRHAMHEATKDENHLIKICLSRYPLQQWLQSGVGGSRNAEEFTRAVVHLVKLNWHADHFDASVGENDSLRSVRVSERDLQAAKRQVTDRVATADRCLKSPCLQSSAGDAQQMFKVVV